MAVLLLHPLGVNGSIWSEVALLLGETSVAPDLAGHGRSRRERPASLEEMTDSLLSTLEAHDESFDLIGMSLGGLVAQDLVQRYPSRVRSVAVLDTVATYPAAARDGFRARARAAQEGGMGAVIDATLESWYTDEALCADLPVVQRTRSALHACDVGGYAAACELLATVDLRGALDPLDVPLLAVAGEHDAAHFTAAAHEFASRARNGTRVLLPGRHAAPLEHAAGFVAAWHHWVVDTRRT